jgi:hypothetical protein
VDLPDEWTGGALTAMEGFRLYLPGDPPFLTTDAQGIAPDAQLQGGGIHAGCQRFQVYRVFIPTAPLRSCRQCLSALRSSGASHTRKEPEGCYQFAAPQMMCTPFHHLK